MSEMNPGPTIHGSTLLEIFEERDSLRAALRTVEQERDEARAEAAVLRKTLDDASYEDGDHLPKECRRMVETLWGEVCAHREQCPKALAEARSALATLMQGELLKDAVVEAAKEWRIRHEQRWKTTTRRSPDPMYVHLPDDVQALADAIDALLAKEQA